jgi:PAS domain S-box-containing protein
MGPLNIFNFVISGICLAVGILHLVLFIRRRDSHVALIFGLMAFTMAASTFIEVWIYRAESIPVYARFFKWQVTANGLMWMLLVWFVADYTGQVRRWLAILVTAGYATATLTNLISPYSVLFLTIEELMVVTLPWGETIASASGPANPMRLVADVSWLLLIYLTVEACIRMGRRGRRRKAIVFGLVLFWTLGVAYVYGTLLDLGLVPPPPLHNISFLLLILIMSGTLINDLLSVPVLRQQVAVQLERWQTLLDNAKMLIFGLDKDGRINFVNPHFQATTGFSEDELIGKALLDIVPVADRESLQEQLPLTLEQGTVREQTDRPLLTKDGDVRHIHWSHFLLRDADQTIAGTLSVGEDVTDVQQYQQALADEKARMDVVLSHLNTGLALLDRDLTVLWVNEMVRRGFPGEDPLGQKCHTVAEHRSSPCVDCGALLALEDGRIHEIERFNSVNNRWYLVISIPIKDAEGRVVQVLESSTDVTEKKQTEADRDRALQELRDLKNKLEAENLQLRQELRLNRDFEDIIGRSNALLYVLERVRQVAATDAGVLLQGETGVGKELFARAIHNNSPRAGQPFIKVNCAAMPQGLVESELFGHEPGAFTGADQRRRGRFELADGGTLLLDEVSEMPLETQAKLLRVLQEGQFERIGGSRTITVDVRVIATSNRQLKQEIAEGRFRTDLFYRLNVYPITVPPLRNRREDIPLLVNYFVPQIAARVGKSINQISPDTLAMFQDYDWPGNVRELRNVIERAIITSTSSAIQIADKLGAGVERSVNGPFLEDWPSMDRLQQYYIQKVLDKVDGRIEGAGGAADILGMNPSTLRHRISKLHIRR